MARHEKDFAHSKYENVLEFLRDVLQNYNVATNGYNGAIILGKLDGNAKTSYVARVELKPEVIGGRMIYSVTTAHPYKTRKLIKKELLYDESATSPPSTAAGDRLGSAFDNGGEYTPFDTSGLNSSSADNIPPSTGNINPAVKDSAGKYVPKPGSIEAFKQTQGNANAAKQEWLKKPFNVRRGDNWTEYLTRDGEIIDYNKSHAADLIKSRLAGPMRYDQLLKDSGYNTLEEAIQDTIINRDDGAGDWFIKDLVTRDGFTFKFKVITEKLRDGKGEFRKVIDVSVDTGNKVRPLSAEQKVANSLKLPLSPKDEEFFRETMIPRVAGPSDAAVAVKQTAPIKANDDEFFADVTAPVANPATMAPPPSELTDAGRLASALSSVARRKWNENQLREINRLWRSTEINKRSIIVEDAGDGNAYVLAFGGPNKVVGKWRITPDGASRNFKWSAGRTKLTPEEMEALRLPQGAATASPGDLKTALDKLPGTPRGGRFAAFKKGLGDKVTEFQHNWTDRFVEMARIEKRLNGEMLDADSSMYKQIANYHGLPEQITKEIKERINPLLKATHKAKIAYDDMVNYGLMIHARDINQKLLSGMPDPSGYTDNEIASVLKDIQDRYNPEQLKVLEAVRLSFVDFGKSLIRDAMDAGYIGTDEGRRILNSWKNRFPMYRDRSKEFVSLNDMFASGAGKLTQQLKGGKDKNFDPIQSFVKDLIKTRTEIAKNKIYENMIKYEDNPFWSKVEVDDSTPPEELADYHKIRSGGKLLYYKVSPDMKMVIDTLSDVESRALLFPLVKFTGLLRAGATLSPEFIVRNPVRDMFGAYINKGVTPLDLAKGAYHTLNRKTGVYDSFIENGGGYGSTVSVDRNALARVVKDARKAGGDQHIVGKILDTPGKLINGLRMFTEFTENMTKVGGYNRFIRKGATEAEAAYQARDLMDFARGGVKAKELNRYIAFMNANIQGKSKVLRSLGKDPLGVSLRLAISMGLPSVAAVVALGSASEYQKNRIMDASDWEKNAYWLVPAPGSETEILRIPKPFDYSVVANGIEAGLKDIMYNDPMAWDNYLTENAINTASVPYMFTGVLPLMEGITNYSFFKGAPLVARSYEGLEKIDQATPSTSDTAKLIAKGISKLPFKGAFLGNFAAPMVIDNTISGYTAGMGKLATMGLDAGLRAGGIAEDKVPTAWNKSQIPGVKAFMINEYAAGKSVDKLYGEMQELTSKQASLRLRGKDLSASELEKLKFLKGKTTELTDINKSVKAIQLDTSLTPEEKRDQINALQMQRNTTAWAVKDTNPREYLTEQAAIKALAKTYVGVPGSVALERAAKELPSKTKNMAPEDKRQFYAGLGVDYITDEEMAWWDKHPKTYAQYQAAFKQAKSLLSESFPATYKPPAEAAEIKKAVNLKAREIARQTFYDSGFDEASLEKKKRLLISTRTSATSADPDPLPDPNLQKYVPTYEKKIYDIISGPSLKNLHGEERMKKKMELRLRANMVAKKYMTDPATRAQLVAYLGEPEDQ